MSTLEAEIGQAAELVWESVLGVSLIRRASPLPALGPVMSACVRISGAWDGAVTIECTAELARIAAASMFGVQPDEVTVADSWDALGELVNMTGGNVKALLPGPCLLSLPSIAEGAGLALRPPSGTLLTTVLFECHGSPLAVRLHQAADA